MPQSYKNAQAEMRRQMHRQWNQEPLTGPLAIYVSMFGEARLDADNGCGAAMDCGTGILWQDDRVSIIPVLLADWRKTKKQDSRWLIHILELSGDPL